MKSTSAANRLVIVTTRLGAEALCTPALPAIYALPRGKIKIVLDDRSQRLWATTLTINQAEAACDRLLDGRWTGWPLMAAQALANERIL